MLCFAIDVLIVPYICVDTVKRMQDRKGKKKDENHEIAVPKTAATQEGLLK